MPGPFVRTGATPGDNVGPDEAIFRFLSSDGSSSGTKNANGNYASATDFWIEHGSRYMVIHRMIVFIEDTTNWSAANYGDLAGPLTNGVLVRVTDPDDTVTLDLLDGVPVKTNAGWSTMSYDTQNITLGAGNEYMVVRWTFAKSGAPLTLRPGHKLKATFEDNLTGLVSHRFMVQGYLL